MAGLESARIMREDFSEYRRREDQVHSGVQTDPNPEEHALDAVPYTTGGILKDYKPPMRSFMPGQKVALLRDLPLRYGAAQEPGAAGVLHADNWGTVYGVASDGLAEVRFGSERIICAPDMCYLVEDAPPAQPLVQHGKMTCSKKAVHMEYVPASALEAIGRRLAVGIERGHQRDNWREGVGNEEAREATINHLLHHIFDYLENGNSSESNTDAIICNAAFLVEYEKHTPYKGVNQRRQNAQTKP